MGQPFGFIPPAPLPVAVPAANGIVATGGILGGAIAGARAGAFLGPKGAAVGALAGALLIPLLFPGPAQAPGLPDTEPQPEPLPGPGLDPGLNPPQTAPPVVPGNPTWYAGLVRAYTDWKPAVYDQYWCGGDKFGTTSGGQWQTLSSYTPRSNRSRIFRIRLFPEWITGRSCTEDTSYDHEVSIIEEWEADGSNRYETIARREAGLRGPSTWYGQGVNEGRIRGLAFEPMPEVPEPGPIAPPEWDPDPAPDPDPQPRPLPIVPLPLAPPVTDPEVPGPIVEPVPEVDPLTAPSPDNPDAPPITIPKAPPATPEEVPDEKPGPSPLPYPTEPGVVPLPQPIPGIPPIKEPSPDPNVQPAPGPAPNPVPGPGPVPIPGPGTLPETPEEPAVVPTPNPPGTPGPGPITTPTTPENPQQVDPGTGIVPQPTPLPVPTPPGSHFPVPGGPPITDGGTRPDLSSIAAEVGRIEQKVARLQNGKDGLDLSDWLWLLPLLRDFFEGDIPGTTYDLQGVCEPVEPGQDQPVAEFEVADAKNLGAIINRLDALPDIFQQHLAWRTPTCKGESPQGEWRTIHFISDEPSGTHGARLLKRFRYRSLGVGTLSDLIDHWSGFTWAAGPVIVKHKDAWWGTPQVWASSGDEGKRVIRHAAFEAGIDPDQVGRWEVGGTSNPRYGLPGTMRVNRKGGYWWITARDGPDNRPTVGTAPPAL